MHASNITLFKILNDVSLCIVLDVWLETAPLDIEVVVLSDVLFYS